MHLGHRAWLDTVCLHLNLKPTCSQSLFLHVVSVDVVVIDKVERFFLTWRFEIIGRQIGRRHTVLIVDFIALIGRHGYGLGLLCPCSFGPCSGHSSGPVMQESYFVKHMCGNNNKTAHHIFFICLTLSFEVFGL